MGYVVLTFRRELRKFWRKVCMRDMYYGGEERFNGNVV